MPTYRALDTTCDDLGLIEHTAPSVARGDVVMLRDGREPLLTARVEQAGSGPFAGPLEVAIARTSLTTSDDSIV